MYQQPGRDLAGRGRRPGSRAARGPSLMSLRRVGYLSEAVVGAADQSRKGSLLASATPALPSPYIYLTLSTLVHKSLFLPHLPHPPGLCRPHLPHWLSPLSQVASSPTLSAPSSLAPVVLLLPSFSWAFVLLGSGF